MATLRIRNAQTGESITLSRDVRHIHPAWVHEQLGTDSESGLQHCLEQMLYDDFAAVPGKADVCGIYMSEEDAERLAEQRRAAANRSAAWREYNHEE